MNIPSSNEVLIKRPKPCLNLITDSGKFENNCQRLKY